MTYPRKSLVSLIDTPYYHVTARCVRRAWLWGFDEYAGKDYSHRKQWVLERLELLARAFAIDICAYAVMSNHYHLVLRVDQQRANCWSREEVIERWALLFARPTLVDRWLQGIASDSEGAAAITLIERWRRQLYDLSWYMRCLNEHLARRANAEDGCKGRFWEGRFKSQALLDEPGLLTAMAYVDLNPIRAGIAPTPEASDFTSVAARNSNGWVSTISCRKTRLPCTSPSIARVAICSAGVNWTDTSHLVPPFRQTKGIADINRGSVDVGIRVQPTSQSDRIGFNVPPRGWIETSEVVVKWRARPRCASSSRNYQMAENMIIVEYVEGVPCLKPTRNREGQSLRTLAV